MIQGQIFTINRTTAKHKYIFSSIIHSTCHGGSMNQHLCVCVCFVLKYSTQYSLGMSNTFFIDRSSGPNEAGSSSSTVIFTYEPSGFDRYTSQFGPNCERNDKKRKYSNPLAKQPFHCLRVMFNKKLACFMCYPC